MKTKGKPSSRKIWMKPPMISSVVILGLLFCLGCGDEEPEIIEILLTPWALSFGTSTNNGPNNLYLVERDVYRSIMMFLYNGTRIELIATSTSVTFPWGIDVNTESSRDLLFVTDGSGSNSRLLALNSSMGSLKAVQGPSLQDSFTAPRGVASLYMGGDRYRVFVADDDRVLVFEFEYDDQTPPNHLFTYPNPVVNISPLIPQNSPCDQAFMEPYGLAVDPDTGGGGAAPALYVIDQNEFLYRFSGIDGQNPTCVRELAGWTDPVKPIQAQFIHPQGVAFGEIDCPDISPDPVPIIAVADTGNNRVVAFTWDGADFDPIALPGTCFTPYPGGSPHDVAFNMKDNYLWATYPSSNALTSR